MVADSVQFIGPRESGSGGGGGYGQKQGGYQQPGGQRQGPEFNKQDQDGPPAGDFAEAGDDDIPF